MPITSSQLRAQAITLLASHANILVCNGFASRFFRPLFFNVSPLGASINLPALRKSRKAWNIYCLYRRFGKRTHTLFAELHSHALTLMDISLLDFTNTLSIILEYRISGNITLNLYRKHVSQVPDKYLPINIQAQFCQIPRISKTSTPSMPLWINSDCDINLRDFYRKCSCWTGTCYPIYP